MTTATDLIEKLASENAGSDNHNIFDLMLTIIHEYYGEANR